jgi:hypothetical protein
MYGVLSECSARYATMTVESTTGGPLRILQARPNSLSVNRRDDPVAVTHDGKTRT